MIEVPDDQAFKGAPLGGGSVLRFGPNQRMRFQFRAVEPEEMVERWYRAGFGMNVLGKEYQGWTNGFRWNGFARPYFDRKTAEEILKSMELFDWVKNYSYVPKDDEFAIYESNTPETPYRVPGEWITVKAGAAPVKLYGLGAGAWTWLEAGKK